MRAFARHQKLAALLFLSVLLDICPPVVIEANFFALTAPTSTFSRSAGLFGSRKLKLQVLHVFINELRCFNLHARAQRRSVALLMAAVARPNRLFDSRGHFVRILRIFGKLAATQRFYERRY